MANGASMRDDIILGFRQFMSIDEEFTQRLMSVSDRVTAQLDSLLVEIAEQGEKQRPARLVAGMRHGVLNGGKRLRPFLMMETANMLGAKPDSALIAACALECIHSYSLVHDDLPAMDDDDLRRGQPTVHIAFDEATAILAGDALLTFAFDLLSGESCHPSANIRVELISLLARAAGQGGMIGGQILDLEAEAQTPADHEIRTLQAMKTGALLRYACEAGAVLAGADASDRQNLIRYGETIGLAFQLADDLLDVTSTSEAMGKKVGKDADRGKGTLVGLHGVETVKDMLNESVEQAMDHLSIYGERADVLRQTAQFIVARSN